MQIPKKVRTFFGKVRNGIKKVSSPSNFIESAEESLIREDKEQALNTLYEGLRYHPKNYIINSMLIDLLREEKDWEALISRLEVLTKHKKPKVDLEMYIEMSMIYQIRGQNKKSKEIFDYILEKYKDEIEGDGQGYRKLILFDNGESRIEFYKKLEKTESVMITFDAINMVWDKPSFAFRLLIKENLDIIAIRKRRARTYQQDLHQTDFMNVVQPILSGYKDKMAYGFSLGAYHTLYFASLLDCRILSISPRLSIHPEFGRTKVIPKHKIEHNITLPLNENISPIILYDPKNALDKNYIDNGVLSSFPNAKLITIPYGGHGLAPQLLKMGILKQIVYSFLNNELPVYDRKARVKSDTYFTNLSRECYKRNKFRWALDLVNKSLELLPKEKKNIKLKMNIFKKMDRLEDAIKFLQSTIKEEPKVLTYRNWLVDNYIEMNELEEAKSELSKALLDFGESKSITTRILRIEDIEVEKSETP